MKVGISDSIMRLGSVSLGLVWENRKWQSSMEPKTCRVDFNMMEVQLLNLLGLLSSKTAFNYILRCN